MVMCSDETTNLTTGAAKRTFLMPFSMRVTEVLASLTTVATGATLLAVDINKNGVSILSTVITIDASEFDSSTAATPAVISNQNLTKYSTITVDIDAVGNTTPGKGLKVYLIGTRV